MIIDGVAYCLDFSPASLGDLIDEEATQPAFGKVAARDVLLVDEVLVIFKGNVLDEEVVEECLGVTRSFVCEPVQWMGFVRVVGKAGRERHMQLT